MSDGVAPQDRPRSAAEACQGVALGDGARALLREGMAARPYIEALIGAGESLDAVKVLARLLAKREAVWWACRCAREAAGPAASNGVKAAIAAAERWVVEQDEEARRAAMPAAEAAGFGTPAGCAAAAAFWSGGSLGPPEIAPIPPGEHLTARGVEGAVLIAAVLIGPERTGETYHTFLAWGFEVADGVNRWNEPQATTPQERSGRVAPQKAPKVLDSWE